MMPFASFSGASSSGSRRLTSINSRPTNFTALPGNALGRNVPPMKNLVIFPPIFSPMHPDVLSLVWAICQTVRCKKQKGTALAFNSFGWFCVFFLLSHPNEMKTTPFPVESNGRTFSIFLQTRLILVWKWSLSLLLEDKL